MEACIRVWPQRAQPRLALVLHNLCLGQDVCDNEGPLCCVFTGSEQGLQTPPSGYSRQDGGLYSWLPWRPGLAALRALRLTDTGDGKHVKLEVGFLLFQSQLLENSRPDFGDRETTQMSRDFSEHTAFSLLSPLPVYGLPLLRGGETGGADSSERGGAGL